MELLTYLTEISQEPGSLQHSFQWQTSKKGWPEHTAPHVPAYGVGKAETRVSSLPTHKVLPPGPKSYYYFLTSIYTEQEQV